MNKALPRDVTSYDLLKTLAVVTMVIDHIGMYFFPDDLWWRAIGRLSFPIWLFLIGYARSRDISPKLLGAGALLALAHIPAGMPIFPLNILLSIALVRLCIDKVMPFFEKGSSLFWLSFGALAILSIPTSIVLEFGTHALLFAVFGYMCRHWGEDRQRERSGFMFATMFSYLAIQSLLFGFSQIQLLVMAVGVTAVCLYTLKPFKPLTFRSLPLAGVLKFCGRYTLEIYAVHVLAFMAAAVYLGREGYGLFQWSWVNLG